MKTKAIRQQNLRFRQRGRKRFVKVYVVEENPFYL